MGAQLSVYILAYNSEDRIAWRKALGSYFKYAKLSELNRKAKAELVADQ
mgnify:FL=1